MTPVSEQDGREIVPGMAEAIRRRMKEVGYVDVASFVKAAGISRAGFRPLELGIRKAYQSRLTDPICRTLQWKDDAIERLMRGEQPAEVSRRGVEPSDRDRIAALERQVGVLFRLSGLDVAEYREPRDAEALEP